MHHFLVIYELELCSAAAIEHIYITIYKYNEILVMLRKYGKYYSGKL